MKDIECKEVIISTLARRGRGVDGDPIRAVLQVWDKSGELIAENDEHYKDLLEATLHEQRFPKVKKHDTDQEPDILAAFPEIMPNHRSHEDVKYPSKDWFNTVYHRLKEDIKDKPAHSPHFQKMHEAILWIKENELS